MRGWKRPLGVLFAAGILLTAGIYAKEEGPSSKLESTAERKSKSAADEPDKELAQLRKTLQNYIKSLDLSLIHICIQMGNGGIAARHG